MIGSRVMGHVRIPGIRWCWRRLATFTFFAALASGLAGCTDAAPEAPADGDAADGDAAVGEAPVEGVHGVAPPAVGGVPSVIVLHPSEPASPPQAQETPRIDQLGLVFTPNQLLVSVGQRVVFTNSESVGHNVHVRFADTDSTVLNVDTDPGGRAELRFEREGGYDVTCDTHPGMRAFIYVSASPYAVFADQDGRFRLLGVPPGSYTASVWSVDPSLRVEHPVEVVGSSTELGLDGG